MSVRSKPNREGEAPAEPDRDEGELPSGWAAAPVGDIVNLVNGCPFKPSHWKQTGLPIIRIQNLNNPNAPFNYCTDEMPEKFRVRNGDLLFAWSGTPGTSFGAHIWEGGDAWLNQHIFRVEFDKQHFDRTFLKHSINRNLTEYIEQAHGGAGLAHITKGVFEKSLLPIAPLAEQRRIVGKLELLLGKVSSSQQRLSRVPGLLKRFRQSVLAAACSGKLTADWREENETAVNDENSVDPLCETPTEWSWTSLNSLCDQTRGICYGVIKLGTPETDGVPCLRTSDVKPLRIEADEVKRISPAISNEFQRSILRSGEVLVNVRGTLGGVAVVPKSMRGWNVSREVAVVPVINVVPQFVANWVATQASQNWLSGVAKGVAYTGINLEDLRLLPVPLPPLSEQQEIVRRVEKLFAFADQIEARLRQAQSHVDRLTQALLAKAFRGELVPTEHALATREGRDYEPADELLVRIRATQASASPAKAKRGKTSKK